MGKFLTTQKQTKNKEATWAHGDREFADSLGNCIVYFMDMVCTRQPNKFLSRQTDMRCRYSFYSRPYIVCYLKYTNSMNNDIIIKYSDISIFNLNVSDSILDEY